MREVLGNHAADHTFDRGVVVGEDRRAGGGRDGFEHGGGALREAGGGGSGGDRLQGGAYGGFVDRLAEAHQEIGAVGVGEDEDRGENFLHGGGSGNKHLL